MATAGNAVLVTGATGFIGRALLPVLIERGYRVVAGSRHPPTSGVDDMGVEWRACDLLRPESLPAAMADVRMAYYLVHSMGSGQARYRDLERRAALAFTMAAAHGGLERIIYLGGPAPHGRPSEHLLSRLEVGETLRAGRVPTLELRASMVIGAGGASWQIVRDLAMRLPAMVLPRWLDSRMRPVALEDVVTALVSAAEMPLQESAWFDLPGPETLSGREILERIAALRRRRIPALEVPLLTPRLSALWLKLVTRADFTLARELVMGLGEDLLPRDEAFWPLIGHTHLVPFDDAAGRALATESPADGLWPWLGRAEERLVDMTALWKPRR
jgi:uncharacterized protein YbjT (DUF2867 family)